MTQEELDAERGTVRLWEGDARRQLRHLHRARVVRMGYESQVPASERGRLVVEVMRTASMGEEAWTREPEGTPLHMAALHEAIVALFCKATS